MITNIFPPFWSRYATLMQMLIETTKYMEENKDDHASPTSNMWMRDLCSGLGGM